MKGINKMDKLQIEIGIPRKELWTNSKANRWVKADAIKDARNGTAVIARVAMMLAGIETGDWKRGRLNIRVIYADERKRDFLNLCEALKGAIDGAIDAGILPDDDDDHLEIGRIRKGKPDKANPRVILTFAKIE